MNDRIEMRLLLNQRARTADPADIDKRIARLAARGTSLYAENRHDEKQAAAAMAALHALSQRGHLGGTYGMNRDEALAHVTQTTGQPVGELPKALLDRMFTLA